MVVVGREGVELKFVADAGVGGIFRRKLQVGGVLDGQQCFVKAGGGCQICGRASRKKSCDWDTTDSFALLNACALPQSTVTAMTPTINRGTISTQTGFFVKKFLTKFLQRFCSATEISHDVFQMPGFLRGQRRRPFCSQSHQTIQNASRMIPRVILDAPAMRSVKMIGTSAMLNPSRQSR